MKKGIITALTAAVLSLSVSFAQTSKMTAAPDVLIETETAPHEFNGIWEAGDRYVIFSQDVFDSQNLQNEKKYIWIYLKTFYGWYTDRAAEPDAISSSNPKDRNDTVFLDNQNILIEFKLLCRTENASAWEIILEYPKIKEKTVIPVAVMNGNIYLDFALNTTLQELKNPEQHLTGSWSKQAKVSGFKVDSPRGVDNLYSMYITDEAVYYIRYWKTDMEYSDSQAYFSDGTTYSVPKHIKSAGCVYTCVTGRRSNIRNVEKTTLNSGTYCVDSQNMIMCFGEPYLTNINLKADITSILELVVNNNSRRAPMPDPPFPPSNLDWHLDDIRRLEVNNALIREFRKRTGALTVEK